jgi:FtsH-binding integral membrane protein
MDAKNLVGFGLTIMGLCLVPIFLLFLVNRGTYSDLFLTLLGVCAIFFVAMGVLILNKHQ